MDAYRFSPVPLIMTGLVTRSVGAGGDGSLTEVGLADSGHEKMKRKRINTMPRLTNSNVELILDGYLAFRYKYIAFISDAVIAAHCDLSSFQTFDQLALPRRHNLTLFSQHYSDLIAIFQRKTLLQALALPPPWTISNHRSLHSHIMSVDPIDYMSKRTYIIVRKSLELH